MKGLGGTELGQAGDLGGGRGEPFLSGCPARCAQATTWDLAPPSPSAWAPLICLMSSGMRWGALSAPAPLLQRPLPGSALRPPASARAAQDTGACVSCCEDKGRAPGLPGRPHREAGRPPPEAVSLSLKALGAEAGQHLRGLIRVKPIPPPPGADLQAAAQWTRHSLRPHATG